MAAEYDVDGRLAEGRSAVDDFAEYVQACQQLGHQHPELARLAEQYAAEEGLNLSALDTDAEAVAAAAALADDAVRQHADLIAALTGAWAGPGAAAALDFLLRHHQAAATAAAAVREAAGALVALRDELWKAVDAKVAATLAIDERVVAQRATWLAAARTVATGPGDRSVASELIDQQVEPFVANDIRADWLEAMRAGSASVSAAYDTAVARMGAGTQPIFEVPGALGPEWVAPLEQSPATASGAIAASVRDPLPSPVGASAGVVPAAVAMPAPAPGTGLAPPAPFMPEPQPQPISSTGAAPPGDLGGGVPGLGGASGLGGMGLSGIGQQLSDLIGGLVGASADATPELPELDSPDVQEPDDESDDASDEEEPAKDPDAEEPAEAEPADAAVESATDVPDEADGPTEPPPPEPSPAPVLAEPGPIPPPDLEVLPEPKTPCEIAADELPQVGE
ncbi:MULTISPECIES: hypothetical protein [unclassified Mycobacterium]|uniref:hypothetical protein n=1 Tax=unclassified Mycobacterium TaxID=2642494 RepID=UPI0029C985FB|nr:MULTISPECIES: hypothetical protein [unclassified Mycobacterium]